MVSSGAFMSSRPRSVTTAKYRPFGEYLITPPVAPLEPYSNNASPTSSFAVNGRCSEAKEDSIVAIESKNRAVDFVASCDLNNSDIKTPISRQVGLIGGRLIDKED